MAQSVVIAGGGTGGHLYPGIALARAIMKNDPDIQVTFIGTQRGIESKVLPREGLPLKTIFSGGLLGKKGMSRLISWCKLPIGMMQSLAYLMFNRPRLVVGVGGYVSGPAVLSAWMLRIPVLIHEQNSIPGVTNRLLAKIADTVAVTFPESVKYFPRHKVVHTGNMIREEFCNAEAPPPVEQGKFVVMVLGGSQGAQAINRAMADALEALAPVKERLHIIHQTGEKDEAAMQQAYADRGFSAEVRTFIFNMAEQYQKASLIVSRSGATTLAEITALGKASILIPFPFASHNHQEHNARALEKTEAAKVILESDLDGQRLAAEILNFIEHPEQLEKMNRCSYQLGQREATDKVRRLCTNLMNVPVDC